MVSEADVDADEPTVAFGSVVLVAAAERQTLHSGGRACTLLARVPHIQSPEHRQS